LKVIDYKLIADDDKKNIGIYAYILTKNERYVGICTFLDNLKQKVYEKQKEICTICTNNYNVSEMEGD